MIRPGNSAGAEIEKSAVAIAMLLLVVVVVVVVVVRAAGGRKRRSRSAVRGSDIGSGCGGKDGGEMEENNIGDY